MAVLAGLSVPELGVALALTLIGVLAREALVRLLDGLQAQRTPLGRWFWCVAYRSDDAGWCAPYFIGLIRLRRQGNRVRGTMECVYPRRGQLRWTLEGRLVDGRELLVTYQAAGDEYGSNGAMILGRLVRGVWCGGFDQTPDPSRRAQLERMAEQVGVLGRIGHEIQEKGHVEWLAADSDPNDAVRRFLASFSAESTVAPVQIAVQLPRAARRMLLEPPLPSRRARMLRAVTYRVWLPRAVRRRVSRVSLVEPAPWESPTQAILRGRAGEDEAA